jgi:hypothetical protein
MRVRVRGKVRRMQENSVGKSASKHRPTHRRQDGSATGEEASSTTNTTESENRPAGEREQGREQVSRRHSPCKRRSTGKATVAGPALYRFSPVRPPSPAWSRTKRPRRLVLYISVWCSPVQNACIRTAFHHSPLFLPLFLGTAPRAVVVLLLIYYFFNFLAFAFHSLPSPAPLHSAFSDAARKRSIVNVVVCFWEV